MQQATTPFAQEWRPGSVPAARAPGLTSEVEEAAKSTEASCSGACRKKRICRGPGGR